MKKNIEDKYKSLSERDHILQRSGMWIGSNKLEISNDYVYFWARFSGVEREIFIPISRVIAIYAKENGVGMQFMPEDSPYDDDDNNPNNPNLPKGLHIVE